MRNLLCVSLLLSHVFGFAQDEPSTRVLPSSSSSGSLHLGMHLAFPQNEFAAVSEQAAFFGIGGGFVVPVFDHSPLALGGQFDYYWTGGDRQTEFYRDPVYGRYEVESTVQGSMIPLHLKARLNPLRDVTDLFNIYLEGLAGFRFTSVRTSIQVDDLSGGPQPEKESDTETSFSWSYGYAGGALVKLTTGIQLHFRVENLYGTSAKYLDPKSIEFDSNGDPEYQVKESRTDILNYSIGVNFRF